MGLLSTPTVSSVPGEYNYFSTGAKVIITAGASGYCRCNLNEVLLLPMFRFLMYNISQPKFLIFILNYDNTIM